MRSKLHRPGNASPRAARPRTGAGPARCLYGGISKQSAKPVSCNHCLIGSATRRLKSYTFSGAFRSMRENQVVESKRLLGRGCGKQCDRFIKSFLFVRRGKAVPPSRCESCPANCRSSRKQSERFMEVTTWIEALRCQRIVLDGSASAQAVTRVNAEQASKRVMRRPTRRNFGEGCQRPGSERREHRSAPPG